MAFASLVGAQLLHALNCRSRHPAYAEEQPSSAVGGIVYGSLAAQGVAAVLPITRLLLGLAPIGPASAGIVLVSALASFLLLRKSSANERASQRLHFVRSAAI